MQETFIIKILAAVPYELLLAIIAIVVFGALSYWALSLSIPNPIDIDDCVEYRGWYWVTTEDSEVITYRSESGQLIGSDGSTYSGYDAREAEAEYLGFGYYILMVGANPRFIYEEKDKKFEIHPIIDEQIYRQRAKELGNAIYAAPAGKSAGVWVRHNVSAEIGRVLSFSPSFYVVKVIGGGITAWPRYDAAVVDSEVVETRNGTCIASLWGKRVMVSYTNQYDAVLLAMTYNPGAEGSVKFE